jgi:hypothetical protein
MFSNNGRVDSKNHTWTTNKAYGYTGGVGVFFYDRDQSIIANLPFHSYGVDGTWIPGLPSDRTVDQVDNLNQDIFNRTVRIDIELIKAPKNRLIDDVNTGFYIAKKIIDLRNDWAKGGRN